MVNVFGIGVGVLSVVPSVHSVGMDQTILCGKKM